MSALAIRFHRGGVYLPQLKLWLDPHEPQTGPDRVFISHAHSDHIGMHREVILSEPTSKLMHARLDGEWSEHVLPFGQITDFSEAEAACKLTLLPAGHILGSAMALIETGEDSLLYTGDFKLRPGLSAEPCEPRHADILIMETTYGRPCYRFPPASEVLKGVARFCREALDNEETPVLLGYSLGKSQELLRGLAEAELPIMLHGAVHKLTRIYEQSGRRFPPYEKYESSSARGKVLLCPPNVVNSAMLRNLGPTRLAVLTGWAVDPNCRYRYQAHAAFPLSDHADFPDLLEMVRRVQPRQVYTLHGFAAEFAQRVRDLGYQAQALSEDEQLVLPLVLPAVRPAVSLPPTPGEAGSAGGSVLNVASQPAASAQIVAEPEPASPQPERFHGFALTCSRIGATARKTEKTACLAAYLKSLSESSAPLVSNWFTGHPFPPIENKALRLGWAVIRDALCGVAGMDQGEFGQCYLKHSDLGETAWEILSQTAPGDSNLALTDVESLFHELHAARGPLSKLPPLMRTLRRCTALEGKYLIKILTGDLRIGLKEGLVEEAVAQAFQEPLAEVKKANLILGNLGETAALARRKQLSAATLVPLRPLKFMLASPEASAAAVWQRVLEWSGPGPSRKAAEAPLPLGPIESCPTVWLEDKYDGIRCQAHKVENRVALFSRDLKEITTTFLDVADLMRPWPESVIVDGELVAMRGDVVLPFAELQKRLGRREGDLFLGAQIPVQLIAFDLLWCGGQSLLNQPLRDRRAKLEQIAGQKLRLAQVTRAHSPEEIDRAFTDARQRGNEGLMIKDPASLYMPGRRGLAWLKLKKARATLDCVVVGAEYGHGKRRAVLSDYTFAVRDEVTGLLQIIGKAYTGLTDAEIAQLTRHFLSKAKRRHGRYFELEPDTVLEIAFDAVQLSERHDSGLALRFPRIARLRPDKSPAQIDTVQTARQLVSPDPASL
jgi:ATP-dependent DNA ligase I